MPVLAPAIHIDHHVATEGLAIVKGSFDCCDHSERIITIDVKNGRFDDLGYVSTVATRTRVRRIGSETNLIINDQVDSAPCAVALELRKVKYLGHDALASDGCISVNKNGQHLLSVEVFADSLTGACFTLNDGVDCFEVTRVGSETDINFMPIGSLALGLKSKVIFYIAITMNGVRNLVFGKLA